MAIITGIIVKSMSLFSYSIYIALSVVVLFVWSTAVSSGIVEVSVVVELLFVEFVELVVVLVAFAYYEVLVVVVGTVVVWRNLLFESRKTPTVEFGDASSLGL